MIRPKTEKKEIIIDLTGPNGNAFFLMAHAKRFAKDLGYSKSESDKIIAEMTSGDYEQLLQIFDSYFGDYVILER